MAQNTLIVRSEAVFVIVGGRRLTAWPAAGTYLSIEKMSPTSTPEDGQNGFISFTRTRSTTYTVTMTIKQGSDDDAWMGGILRALEVSNSVTPVTVAYNGTVYASGGCDVPTNPTRELAGDGTPMMTWVLVGTFPVADIVSFATPSFLTESEISTFVAG